MPIKYFFKCSTTNEIAGFEALNSDIALEECLRGKKWPPDRIIYLGKGSEAPKDAPTIRQQPFAVGTINAPSQP